MKCKTCNNEIKTTGRPLDRYCSKCIKKQWDEFFDKLAQGENLLETNVIDEPEPINRCTLCKMPIYEQSDSENLCDFCYVQREKDKKEK